MFKADEIIEMPVELVRYGHYDNRTLKIYMLWQIEGFLNPSDLIVA